MKIPIALQLYSVRDDASADLFGVLKKVAQMGYDGVEFAGYYGNDPQEIRKALDDLGLKVEGTHTPIDAFDDAKLQETVDLHHTLGATFAIVPWIPESLRNSPEAALETAKRFDEIAAKLAPHGIRTGFHAHECDMKPLANGKTAWDIIAANTSDAFILQYDTANGLMGGADPVQPIRDWPNRNASLHLKGWGDGKAALVGEGDINWPDVFEAAENGGGVEWYVVEHEEPVDALISVEKCLENLRRFGK